MHLAQAAIEEPPPACDRISGEGRQGIKVAREENKQDAGGAGVHGKNQGLARAVFSKVVRKVET